MPRSAGTADRLIDAAEAELIAHQGHMEMSAVARRAEVSTGLAYHHFGSKTGLIAAVVDRFYGPVRDIALGAAIPVDMAWAEREKARANALIDYFYRHPLAPLISGRLGREPEVIDIEHAHRDALVQEGARNLAQGQKHGVIDPTLDPTITVAVLMGGLRAAIDRAISAKSRPSKTELLEQVWRITEGALALNCSHAAASEGDPHVRV